MKRCATCRTLKSTDEFSINSTSLDGYQSQCKKCQNRLAKAKRDKRKAELALWHRRAQGLPDYPGVPTRKCPRCKELKTLSHFSAITPRTHGRDCMCNECRWGLRDARNKIKRAKIVKERQNAKYRAKMKKDAEQWRAYQKKDRRFWQGSIVEDAKLWREHVKEEGIRVDRLQAEINSWPEPDKMLPH